MSESDDDFICPDCEGDGEVQCINLGSTFRSDTLPCPTCIAHEIEQERASKADEITRLTAENEKLRAALHEAADELDGYYRASYPGDHPYSKERLADAMRDNPARAALEGKR